MTNDDWYMSKEDMIEWVADMVLRSIKRGEERGYTAEFPFTYTNNGNGIPVTQHRAFLEPSRMVEPCLCKDGTWDCHRLTVAGYLTIRDRLTEEWQKKGDAYYRETVFYSGYDDKVHPWVAWHIHELENRVKQLEKKSE